MSRRSLVPIAFGSAALLVAAGVLLFGRAAATPRTPSDTAPAGPRASQGGGGSDPGALDAVKRSGGLAPALRPAAPGRIRLVLTGDVALNWRGTSPHITEFPAHKNPLRFFAPVFKAADLAVSNMEGVLMRRDPQYAMRHLNLWAPWASGQIFTPVGIKLVTTANNHAFDGRDVGVLETLEHLKRTGLEVMGTGRTEAEARRPYFFRKGAACVALVPATTKSNMPVRGEASLAFYPKPKEGELLTLVRETKSRCAFVIVYIHWGYEMQHLPHRTIKRFARAIVDAGADLVVGHHPHVLQGVEFRGKAAIVYSLGNFVFSNPNEATRRTGVLVVDLHGGAKPSLAELSLIPAHIHRKDYTVRPASPRQARDVMRRVALYSRVFRTQVVLREGRLRFLPSREILPP